METYYRRVHPVGALQATARTLRSANGTGIESIGVARAARCHFWDCERSSPLSSAAWRREQTRSLGRMCWDLVCHIRSTSRMDCYLHKVGRRYSCTGGIRPCPGRVFTVGHSSIPPYSEAVLHCSVRTTGGRALPSSGLLEGLTLVCRGDRPHRGKNLGLTPLDGRFLSWCQISARETVMVNPFTEVGMICPSDRHTVSNGR